MSNGFGHLGLGLVMLTRAACKHRRTIAAELRPVLRHVLRRAQALLRWLMQSGFFIWLGLALLAVFVSIIVAALPFVVAGVALFLAGAAFSKARSWLRGNKEVPDAPDRREHEPTL